MAISPADFYQLAGILQRQSKGGDDAALRSCISRAYYSAFLGARDARQLSSTGRTGHKDVISHYRKVNNPAYTAIANSLEDLKDLREKADYDVHLNCTTKDGTDAMTQASKVKKLLNQVLPP
ncbi:MAG TPA: hypothetical protein VFY31_07220 [Macromonas sp.]|nr:hypothetical protein [Macromonas sp.]